MSSCVRFQMQGSMLVCMDGSMPLLYIYSNGNVLVSAEAGTGNVFGPVTKVLRQLGASPEYIRYGDAVYGLPVACRIWSSFNRDPAGVSLSTRPKKVLEIKPPPAMIEEPSKVVRKTSKTDDFKDMCIVCIKTPRDAVLGCGHATMCKPCHYWWLFDVARKGKSSAKCALCCEPAGEECSTASCNRPWSNEMFCGCKLCAVCVLRSWNTKNLEIDCRCCSAPTYSKASRHCAKPKIT